jgi:hypothetical protein
MAVVPGFPSYRDKVYKRYTLSFATALILWVEVPFLTTMMKIVGKSSGTGGGIMNMGTNAGEVISPV